MPNPDYSKHVYIPGKQESEKGYEPTIDVHPDTSEPRYADIKTEGNRRPRVRNKDMMQAMGKAIRTGLSYRHACAMLGLNYGTFLRWKQADPRVEAYFSQCRAEGAAKLMHGLYEKATIELDTRAIIFLLERVHGYTARNAEFEAMQNQLPPGQQVTPEMIPLLPHEKKILGDLLMKSAQDDKDFDGIAPGGEMKQLPSPEGEVVEPEPKTYTAEDLADGPLTIDQNSEAEDGDFEGTTDVS